MDLTYDDVIKILKIIDQSSYGEMRLEVGDLTIIVRKQGLGTAPGLLSASAALEGGPPAPRRADPARSAPDTGCVVKAPMVGVFYRAPSPGAPPFVDVGSLVTEDETVCIVEVMKLMHSIKAGFRGRVAEILAKDGVLVEYGQSLIVIAPQP